MAGYNRIIMIGNLTRDPDYKQLASGQPVCRLGLASNRQFRNRQTGDMVQEVCFVDVDVWGAQADSCNQYLQKGRAVLIEGRLKFDQWEDQTGQSRNKHSIVADRVVFLSTNTEQFEGATKTADGPKVEPNNEMERELMAQIQRIKNKDTQKQQPAAQPTQQSAVPAVSRATSTKQTTASESTQKASGKQPTPTGEIDFKDEPPFQDDLPF